MVFHIYNRHLAACPSNSSLTCLADSDLEAISKRESHLGHFPTMEKPPSLVFSPTTTPSTTSHENLFKCLVLRSEETVSWDQIYILGVPRKSKGFVQEKSKTVFYHSLISKNKNLAQDRAGDWFMFTWRGLCIQFSFAEFKFALRIVSQLALFPIHF